MPKKTTTVKKVTAKKVAKKAPVKKAVAKKAPVKKVTKKVVAKKTPVKKVATKKAKSSAEKSLVYANADQSFWLNDGRVLDSMVTLNDALNEMEKAVYEHHVNVDKHDFAEWVDHVLCDEKCAAELRKAKDSKKARTIVEKHLKLYKI